MEKKRVVLPQAQKKACPQKAKQKQLAGISAFEHEKDCADKRKNTDVERIKP
jgi:hypothetical protein